MPTPQPGIFSLGTRSHGHLEFDRKPGAKASAIIEAVAQLREPRASTGGANLVFGVGPTIWLEATGSPGVHAFVTIEGADGFSMPATQHDVWLWVGAATEDTVFDTTRIIAMALDPVATLAAETRGFTYHDSRDLSGFIDGTENPAIDEAVTGAVIADGPDAGGSVVLVQRWRHDLDAFHALSLGEQEAVIGRTKMESEELETQPAGSHLDRVVIDDDGEELEIFRRSTPYGTLADHGLLFVAFSADQGRLDRMLRRMAGCEDGVRDRLTHYSTPLTGSYYLAPPMG